MNSRQRRKQDRANAKIANARLGKIKLYPHQEQAMKMLRELPPLRTVGFPSMREHIGLPSLAMVQISPSRVALDFEALALAARPHRHTVLVAEMPKHPPITIMDGMTNGVEPPIRPLDFDDIHSKMRDTPLIFADLNWQPGEFDVMNRRVRNRQEGVQVHILKPREQKPSDFKLDLDFSKIVIFDEAHMNVGETNFKDALDEAKKKS